ncbi:IS5/IS1182 family transposase, partial [[Kitasatospora] papulosa]
DVDWLVSVDSTITRAHQHAAGARKKGQALQKRRSLGRSRGGLTTKIHLACDGHGRPLSFVVTGGNINDCTQFEQVLAQISVRRPG